MAKKRQLAGKTTKLAKLPLTLALAEQAEETGLPTPPVPAAPGVAEPLGAVYLHVIRELTSLLSELRVGAEDASPHSKALLPPHVPKPQQLKQALLMARHGLQDLQQLLLCRI